MVAGGYHPCNQTKLQNHRTNTTQNTAIASLFFSGPLSRTGQQPTQPQTSQPYKVACAPYPALILPTGQQEDAGGDNDSGVSESCINATVAYPTNRQQESLRKATDIEG